MAISLKSEKEIATMRECGKELAHILNAVAKKVRPGITTKELDAIAQRMCKERGVRPACLGYHGFPASICTSVNDQCVHCIPSSEVTLLEGDIIALDFVVEKNGWLTDACRTMAVGEISPKAKALLETTKQALYVGIDAAKAGGRVGDISSAIQTFIEERGYSAVRECVGHGIGRYMHEDPEVPNWGRPKTGPTLSPGMTICIEPIINTGSHHILTEEDGWTTRTKDGGLCAHFEHTVHITKEGPEILTPWDEGN